MYFLAQVEWKTIVILGFGHYAICFHETKVQYMGHLEVGPFDLCVVVGWSSMKSITFPWFVAINFCTREVYDKRFAF